MATQDIKMYSTHDPTSWAQFETGFVVTSSNHNRRLERRQRQNSGAGSKAWMEHPVAVTSSIAPLPPPPVGSPRGNAVSTDRWSKQIKVKQKRSSSSRRVNPTSPSAKSVSSLPSELHSTRQRHGRVVDATKKNPLEQYQANSSTASSSSGSDPVKNAAKPSRSLRNSTDFRQSQASAELSNNSRHSRSLHERSRESLKLDNYKQPATSTSHAASERNEGVEKHRRTSSSNRHSSKHAPEPATEGRNRVDVASRRSARPPEVIQTADDNNTKKDSSQTPRARDNDRGRSSSRPPGRKDNVRSMSRTRSASLTRVTNIETAGVQLDKRSRQHRPPPSTFRTQQELRMSSPSKRRARSISDGDHIRVSQTRLTNGNDATSFGNEAQRDHSLENVSKRGIMEKLFGNQVEKPMQARVSGSLGFEFRPRVLLAATVYQNAATNLWITTINTNQKGVAKNPATANKYLKAFSFSTEREARQSAIANAPPKMVPFQTSPCCFICQGSFAVFRRASHCRNCGVCVCNNCSTNWSSKNIPATYNLKNESQVKICHSCNRLSLTFKNALLGGDFDEAVAIYNTGNINLRTPFPSNKKDELMWPVHCAVEGGNLRIIRWLVDQHFCPIKYCAGINKKAASGGKETAITTSKGRSVLSIALECHKVEVMRYLVVDCNVSVYECKELHSALQALEAALMALPHTISEVPGRTITTNATLWDKASFDDVSEPSSLGVDDHHDNWTIGSKSNPSKSSRTGEICIICRCHTIDCVATACGHQVCCFECSTSLLTCPVCNEKGNFIKVFRQ
jgi:FYVE zinc finger